MLACACLCAVFVRVAMGPISCQHGSGASAPTHGDSGDLGCSLFVGNLTFGISEVEFAEWLAAAGVVPPAAMELHSARGYAHVSRPALKEFFASEFFRATIGAVLGVERMLTKLLLRPKNGLLCATLQ